jgi:hypothetical protein
MYSQIEAYILQILASIHLEEAYIVESIQSLSTQFICRITVVLSLAMPQYRLNAKSSRT